MDLNFLIEVIKNRKVNDDNKSYTSSLFRKGLQECCKKYGEESVEVIIAALEKKESNLKEEVADLIYHLLVLLEISDVDFDESFINRSVNAVSYTHLRAHET